MVSMLSSMNMVWEKLRKIAGEAWKAFMEWLRDELGRMVFGIIVAMFGAAIWSGLLVGFGLGVIFASALGFYWQRKKIERDRA